MDRSAMDAMCNRYIVSQSCRFLVRDQLPPWSGAAVIHAPLSWSTDTIGIHHHGPWSLPTRCGIIHTISWGRDPEEVMNILLKTGGDGGGGGVMRTMSGYVKVKGSAQCLHCMLLWASVVTALCEAIRDPTVGSSIAQEWKDTFEGAFGMGQPRHTTVT